VAGAGFSRKFPGHTSKTIRKGRFVKHGILMDITPVILTFNEAPNIARTLQRLTWAKDIVVVDSGSTDGTDAIVKSFPNARLFVRPFDSHSSQWNFAVHDTGVRTEWVLALDADYQVTDGLREEMAAIKPADGTNGFRARFLFSIYGTILPGSAYPPMIVLFRPAYGRYLQDGHTQKLELDGNVENLRCPLVHDDRKTTERWVASQVKYALLEYDKFRKTPNRKLSVLDKIRTLKIVAPFVVLLFCLFVKRCLFRGKAGIFYAFQRTTLELLLSLILLENDLQDGPSDAPGRPKHDL